MRVVHLHIADSVFSDCEQIVKKICFVVFGAEILQQFSLTFTKRLLTSCVFLSHSETLLSIRSFDSIEIFIRVD